MDLPSIAILQMYSDLEMTKKFSNYQVKTPSLEALSADDFFKVSIEVNASSILNKDHILKIFKPKEQEVKEYLLKRIDTTYNLFLKARYSEFIGILTQNNSFHKKAFDYYFSLLTEIPAESNNEQFLNFDYLIEKCLTISILIKYQKDLLRNKIEKLLKSPSLPDKAKCSILLNLMNRNIKTNEIECIPFIAYKIALKIKDIHWKERALEAGHYFVYKFPGQQKLKNKIFELSGDHELQKADALGKDTKNIIIPHRKRSHYEKAISFYKEAKADMKMKNTLRVYEENKKDIKFIRFTAEYDHKTIKRKNEASDRDDFDNLIMLPKDLLILELISGLSSEYIKKMPAKESKGEKKYFHQQYLQEQKADINLNFMNKEAGTFAADRTEQQKWAFLADIHYRLLGRIIREKKITFYNLYSFLLKHTSFGITHYRLNNLAQPYTWYSLIHEGLLSFLNAFSNYIQKRPYSYMLAIDSLTPKFESILRDIVDLSEGNRSEKRKQSIRECLLDDLLNDPVLDKTFSNEDIYLFKQTFTNNGLNIRNDVAHGFYIPMDYNFIKILQIMICIFRLIKFNTFSEFSVEKEVKNSI